MTEIFKKYIAKDMMRCTCESCEETFYICSNFGALKCPHCHSEKIVSEWITPKAVFIPEKEIKKA
jgi:Zn finger protein HypA/HybF involved in hydrogenase expression